MTLYILEVYLKFLWWCASKTEKTKVSKLHSIRVSHILEREIQYKTICQVDLDMF